MTNLTITQGHEGLLIATPYLRSYPNSHSDKTYLRIAGEINGEIGARTLFAQARQSSCGNTAIVHDRIRFKNAPPSFQDVISTVFKTFGEELIARLYNDDPVSAEEEFSLLSDWYETTLSDADDRWVAREDARIHGKIRQGDYVILKKIFPGHGQILRFDQSYWRNEISFIDPAASSPESVGRFRFDAYRPRRLSEKTISYLDLADGYAPSSKGHWSSHELLQMIETNRQNAETQGKNIYAFD